MMTKNADSKMFEARNQLAFHALEDLVPQDHLLRKIDRHIDFTFIYDIVEDVYCQDNGRPSIDPITLIKIPIIQYLFGIPSMRQTIREIQVNVAYRWFLGLSLTDPVPHFSPFGKNYKRRFESQSLAEQIFSRILQQCLDAGVVDPKDIFIDGTHVKACANGRKYTNEEVQVQAKWLANELMDAIQDDREVHGKKPLKNTEKECSTKSQKTSLNDPDAGWFHKGDHKQVFAYNIQTACDRNGWVLGYSVHPGNTHDTQAFPTIFDKVASLKPVHLIADSGYKTPTIAQFLLNQEITPVFPYTRPKRQKENRYIVYDEYYDWYLDENNMIYHYTTTDRKGYREYKASRQDREDYQNNRVITRHVWQGALETCEDIRHLDGMRDLYKERKESIERLFGTAKEHHGFRYTHLIGQALMDFKAGLTYACLNMKKLANILEMRS